MPSIRETIAALGLGPEDTAAAALALRYARIIDECRDPQWGLRWIGPELLRALSELGATPQARARVKPAKVNPPRTDFLDQMRQARRTQV